MSKEVELKVKEEIEKLLKEKFIRPTRYVQWLANIVLADMLVDSTANNELLSFIDGFSRYNQILITVDNISKTALRCPSSL